MDPFDKDNPSKDPYLPPLHRIGDLIAPKPPQDIASSGVEENALTDLAVKLGFVNARVNTKWLADQLHISMPLSTDVLTQACRDGLMEETMQTSAGLSHYRITQRGREHATRLMEVCAYIGPAPVRLESYSAFVRWQFSNSPTVTPEHVTAALSNLVMTPKAAQLAGLAASSGRSLFVFGPPGNGKSSLGRMIHSALQGDFWVPYAISVGNSIIRMYDDQAHHKVELPADKLVHIDQRWVRIKRPFVVVGGELTIELLDLVYSPTLRYYESPPHLKSNGGVFLVDDFGRERISPEQLLNRFITPMEHQIDYMSLCTGQKIQVPLRHVLIIATNLSPEKVTDPAFLRRMGYRIYMGAPNAEQYTKIFTQYAAKFNATVAPEVMERILDRYKATNKELRGCEPRDLIERARDICRFHNRPLELSNKVLDLAWAGYFGE